MELKNIMHDARHRAYRGAKSYVENNPRVSNRLALVSFAAFQASALIYVAAVAWTLSRASRRAQPTLLQSVEEQ